MRNFDYLIKMPMISLSKELLEEFGVIDNLFTIP